MRLIRVGRGNLDSVVAKAAEIIKKDGLVVYPTETLYGLGANVLSKKAILKVFEVKGRGFKKPLSIALPSLEEAKKLVYFNKMALKLAKNFLPGPLTMLLRKRVELPRELTFGSDLVGIRIPNHPVALSLLRAVRIPLTATSANLSGGKDPVVVEDVVEQIGGAIDLVLDCGRCKFGRPSTVIDVSSKRIKIIREGVISKEDILVL